MGYTSVSEIRDRLPLITPAVRTDEQVESYIEEAGAVIDGYLRKVYVLPLEEPYDPLVNYIALDLACGFLLENVYGEETPNDVGQPRLLKDRALKFLNEIRTGVILLTHEGYAAPPPAVGRESLTSEDTERSLFSLDPDTLAPVD